MEKKNKIKMRKMFNINIHTERVHTERRFFEGEWKNVVYREVQSKATAAAAAAMSIEAIYHVK
jgi:formylmethanofuran:tetrahydromethanopterin formyltransferase